MGYVFVLGPCLVCEVPFTYNPEKVPSQSWPPPDGPREPICEGCMALINRKRERLGMPPHPIHPDAYEAAEW